MSMPVFVPEPARQLPDLDLDTDADRVVLPDLIETDVQRRQRVSETMRCRRMRVMYGRGHIPDEPDDELAGYYERGIQLEDYLLGRVRDRLRADGHDFELSSQFPLETPFGGAHLDLVVTFAALDWTVVVDVKSRTALDLTDDAVWQLRAYMHYWGETYGYVPDRAFIATVHPSNLRERWFPVHLAPEHRRRIEREERVVHELIERRALKWEELPKRTCEHPGEGKARMCRMVSECFADWNRGPAVLEDPTVAMLARRLARAKTRASRLERQAKAEKAKVAALQDGLSWAVPPRSKVVAGGVELRRTPVETKSLSLAQAKKSGAMTRYMERKLAPHVSTSSYDRWTVKAGRRDGDG